MSTKRSRSGLGATRKPTAETERLEFKDSDALGGAYDLAIDAKGHVEGEVGNLHVTFGVTNPA